MNIYAPARIALQADIKATRYALDVAWEDACTAYTNEAPNLDALNAVMREKNAAYLAAEDALRAYDSANTR